MQIDIIPENADISQTGKVVAMVNTEHEINLKMIVKSHGICKNYTLKTIVKFNKQGEPEIKGSMH